MEYNTYSSLRYQVLAPLLREKRILGDTDEVEVPFQGSPMRRGGGLGVVNKCSAILTVSVILRRSWSGVE